MIGLWTALVLRERGHDVTVVSPLPSCMTHSSAAACVVTPLFPNSWNHRDNCFQASWRRYKHTIERLRHIDESRPENLKLLEKMPSYECGFEANGQLLLEKGFSVDQFRYLPFADVEIINFEQNIVVQNHLNEQMDCSFCAHFDADYCNTEVFFEYLNEYLTLIGVKFECYAITESDILSNFDKDVVFNCSGYSSKSLFNDASMYPVRGQSMFINMSDLQPPFFGIAAGHHAVFKHRRGYYIGSYFIENEGNVPQTPSVTEYELSREYVSTAYPRICYTLGFEPPHVDLSLVSRVNIGIRPFRPDGPRVEVDYGLYEKTFGRLKLIHNYGHGAHGWTIGYGSAVDSVNLAETEGWMS